MANNRLYIGCPCGGTFFLGKYYPYHWEFGSWHDNFQKEINAWLYEHRHAHENDPQWGELNKHSPFFLVTENEMGDPLTKEKRTILNAVSDQLKR